MKQNSARQEETGAWIAFVFAGLPFWIAGAAVILKVLGFSVWGGSTPWP